MSGAPVTPWDGVPEHPERDGWHWLQRRQRPLEAIYWDAEVSEWEGRSAYVGHMPIDRAADEWIYLGPCALPSEVSALRAAWERSEEASQNYLQERDMARHERDAARAGAKEAVQRFAALSLMKQEVERERDAAQAALVAAWRQGVEAAANVTATQPAPFCGEYDDVSYYTGYGAAKNHAVEAIRALQPPSDLAALRASHAQMLAALGKALPVLEEAYRWHRSMQSDAGRVLEAHGAAEAARTAIANAEALS